MNSPLPPRGTPPLPLRGTVGAVGYVFDRRLGDAEARVLTHWRPGARVGVSADHLALVGLPEHRVDSSRAPGQPLVRVHGRYVGAEGAEARLAASAPTDEVWVLAGGVLTPLALDWTDAASSWLLLGPLTVLDALPLAPTAAATMRAPTTESVREALGGRVPAPAEEAQALQLALEAGTATRPGGGGARSWLTGAALRFIQWLRPSRPAAPTTQGATRQAASKVGWWARLEDHLARALLGTRLGQVLAQAQSRAIMRLLALLEDGDVHEALRQAIPLASLKDALTQPSAQRLSGATVARHELTLSYDRPGATRSVAVADELVAHLRRTYRALFERLDAQGRAQEAAFVLAELLREDEEAVAYLERLGELRNAARLAEARGCTPGLVVRAWFLAGDVPRALQVALEHHAYHDAVTRLEAGKPGSDARLAAERLRRHWADARAEAGDLAGAVTVLPRSDGPLAVSWIRLGLASPGDQGPALLLELALRSPGDEAAEAAARWFDAIEPPEQPAAAAALSAALMSRNVNTTPAMGAVARQHCQRLLRSAAMRSAAGPTGLVDLARVADPMLAADLPAGPVAKRGWPPSAPVRHALRGGGPVPVADAVLLPNGSWLLAEGESGVSRVDSDGYTLERYDAPASWLVLSARGTHALALAPRGSGVQVARLDLVRRRVRSLGLLRLTVGCPSFDGQVWYAADGKRLLALDVSGADARCFWAVELPAPVAQIYQHDRELELRTGAPDPETWVYELPSRVLRRRSPARTGTLPFASSAFDLGSPLNDSDDQQGDTPAAGLLVAPGRSAVVTAREGGGVDAKVDFAAGAFVELSSNSETRVHLTSDHLWLATYAGALACVNLNSGRFTTLTVRGRRREPPSTTGRPTEAW